MLLLLSRTSIFLAAIFTLLGSCDFYGFGFFQPPLD
jgi:hypothetical protein